MLTHIVTYRCNARCIMCDSWKKQSHNELDVTAIERIYRQLPPLGIVRLSGGEPFVRSDLLEIVRLAQRLLRPAVLHLTSNGFQTRRIVDLCENRARDNPLMLLISIDAVGDRHDEIRGVPQAWKRAIATVEALAPRQKELGIRLMVNQTVVDGSGADEHRRLWRRLERCDVPVNLVVAYAESATYTEGTGDLAPDGSLATHGELARDDVRRLVAEARRHLHKLRWSERLARRYYLDGVASRLLDESASPNPPCAALGHHLRILPNGDVPTCQFNSEVVGNLAEGTYGQVWTSDTRRLMRAWVRRCPGCWAECEVLPSALFSADFLFPNSARPGPDRARGWQRSSRALSSEL